MSLDLVAWLRDSALPLWGDVGVDAAAGTFVERLDLDGRPLVDVPRRVMVQARQIFVFAEAHARGWHQGAALAERAGEAMVRIYRRDDGGFVFSATRDGRAVDETRDFYAQAFVLLALASLARLGGAQRWLALADATLAFLDTHLATPAPGGYAESLPATPGPRRQNPHMHLYEALLALDEIAPDGRYRRRIAMVLDLFYKRFLHGPHPVLVEHYEADLRPATGAPFLFEPGHHFEWAWLLARDAALSGTSPPLLAARLCDIAHRLGATRDGAYVDEVDGDGRQRVCSMRLWPCAEAIRAASLGLGGAALDPRAIATSMRRLFLSRAPEGCWIDHLAADGAPLSTFVPASSLYHIVGAASALEELTPGAA